MKHIVLEEARKKRENHIKKKADAEKKMPIYGN